MSLVSNVINAAQGKLGSHNEGQVNYDLNDKTFSDLLEKQMDVKNEGKNNLISNFGIPAQFENIVGVDIQDLLASAASRAKDSLSQIEATGEDMLSSSEMVAFLEKPFNSRSSLEHNLGLMNFAKKHAAGFYNKCASNVVTNLTEFVEDTLKLS